MKYGVYAIQDVMIGFNSPVLFKTPELAQREFKNFLENTPNSKDMRLFHIGNFDDETGELTSVTPSIVGGGN